MNTSDRTEPGSIIVDCDLDEPPEKVWRALTTPELMAVWLGDGDIGPEVGRRFDLKAPIGPVECEVLEAEPERRLRLAWRERDEAGGGIESEVDFILTPTITGGTRLRLVHDGFIRAGVCVRAVKALARLHRRAPATAQWRLAWAA